MSEPDLAILITAANRCLADRLGQAVATAGGEAMRPAAQRSRAPAEPASPTTPARRHA